MIVSLYIRKADEQKWKQLQNKTALISDLLNANSISNNETNANNDQTRWSPPKGLMLFSKVS